MYIHLNQHVTGSLSRHWGFISSKPWKHRWLTTFPFQTERWYSGLNLRKGDYIHPPTLSVADYEHDKILAIAREPCPKSQWEGNFHKDTQPSEEKEYHTRRARYVDISKFQNIWATCSSFHTKLNLKKLKCQLLRARMATSPISSKSLLCAIAFSDILNPLTKHEHEEM